MRARNPAQSSAWLAIEASASLATPAAKSCCFTRPVSRGIVFDQLHQGQRVEFEREGDARGPQRARGSRTTHATSITRRPLSSVMRTPAL